MGDAGTETPEERLKQAVLNALSEYEGEAERRRLAREAAELAPAAPDVELTEEGKALVIDRFLAGRAEDFPAAWAASVRLRRALAVIREVLGDPAGLNPRQVRACIEVSKGFDDDYRYRPFPEGDGCVSLTVLVEPRPDRVSWGDAGRRSGR